MKRITLLSVSLVSACALAAQQPDAGLTSMDQSARIVRSTVDDRNLPGEKIGREDLLGISVYDSPELTRTVRVDEQGNIRLPMLKQHVKAEGLSPAQLEIAITAALTEGNVLVDPVVTVTITENRSHPITVSGAVRNPTTFQVNGSIRLQDAILKAGGITDNAGSEVLITRHPSSESDPSVALVQRIPVRDLMLGADPTLNIALEGGEDIRVPEAGRFYILGKVKHPGVFTITDGSESSIMKAMAMSDGLDSFPSHTAYIYRVEGGKAGRSEIPVEIKKIMERKSPDVAIMANDILYIPDAKGARLSARAIELTLGVGLGVAGLVLAITR